MQTAMQRVVGFVANLDLAQVPEGVFVKAKVTVLHDLGVALAGHRLAGPAYDVAKELGQCGDHGARLLVEGPP